MRQHVIATPVRYNGIVYRSVSEARLAVFLTALNIPFVPEPRAYLVAGVAYLPDFELPHQMWVEVKGPFEPPLDAWRKAALVVLAARRVLLFWSGDNWVDSGLYVVIPNATVFLGQPPDGTPLDPARDFVFEHGTRAITVRRKRAFWTICPECNSPGLVVGDASSGWCFGCDRQAAGDRRHPRLLLAAQAARAIQFERVAQPPPRRARGYPTLRPNRYRRK